MFLIKWKSLYASGSPSKNVSSNNLNRTIRLNVAKTEIIEKVVTVQGGPKSMESFVFCTKEKPFNRLA